MAQTSVSDRMAIGFAGMLADSGRDKVTRSYVNSESSAEIPFGVMVCQGTGDNDALLLHTSAAAMVGAMIGVVVHSHEYAKPNQLGTTGLKPDVAMSVLTQGRVMVEVEEAVVAGGDVRVRAVVAGDEVAGAFRTTADDTTDCVDISTFARYLTSAGAGELAIVEIDMTNRDTAVADT